MTKPQRGTYDRTARSLIRHRNIMLGLPLRKIYGAKNPYGYEDDPDNEGWLRPVDRELRLLYKAKTLRPRSTLKALAIWLTKETGKSISIKGLQSILEYRPPLQAYELTLDERLRIATSPTEDTAIELASSKSIATKKQAERRKGYYERREAVIRARKAREEGKSNIPSESGSSN